MKAYVSLHTDLPRDQIDHEVSYKGYKRLEVDFDEERLKTDCLRAVFPRVQEVGDQVANYAAVGSASEGQGILFLVVPVREMFNPESGIRLSDFSERRTDAFWLDLGVPDNNIAACIEANGYTVPRVAIYDGSPVVYPASMNPIAREAHKLVRNMLIRPEEIPHQLFEMINAELAAHGIHILQVRRQGAAKMCAKMEKLRLSQWGTA